MKAVLISAEKAAPITLSLMVMASKNAPAQGWRMVNVDLFVPFLQRQTRCPARVVVVAVAFCSSKCACFRDHEHERAATHHPEPLSGAVIRVFLIVFSFGRAHCGRRYATLNAIELLCLLA